MEGCGEDAAEWLVLSKESKSGYYYNRSNSTDLELLTNALSKRYNAQQAMVLPSGMAAISTALQVMVQTFCIEARDAGKTGVINMFIGNELYCDTPRVCQHLQKQHKAQGHPIQIQIYEVDVTHSVEELKDLVSSHSHNSVGNILLFETSTNPSGHMLDPSFPGKLRKWSIKGGIKVILDNTWLSSAAYVPLLRSNESDQEGADVIVMSLTKYYSGGTAIAGALATNNSTFAWECGTHIRMNGMHVSPHNAKLIHEALVTVDERIEKSSDLTVKILKQLRATHPDIPLIHPSLPEHPSHTLMSETIKLSGSEVPLYPSVFTFKVTASKNKALSALQSTKVAFKTSFGAPMSRLDPWPTKEGDFIVCRLAVGYEDSVDRVVEGVAEVARICGTTKESNTNAKGKGGGQQPQQQKGKGGQQQQKGKGGQQQQKGEGQTGKNRNARVPKGGKK